jgi:hypothetical protein
MTRKIEPLALPRALNRQGVDGAYLLLSGTTIEGLPEALAELKPAGVPLDEAGCAPVSGDHVRRWRDQEWTDPAASGFFQLLWSVRGVAA